MRICSCVGFGHAQGIVAGGGGEGINGRGGFFSHGGFFSRGGRFLANRIIDQNDRPAQYDYDQRCAYPSPHATHCNKSQRHTPQARRNISPSLKPGPTSGTFEAKELQQPIPAGLNLQFARLPCAHNAVRHEQNKQDVDDAQQKGSIFAKPAIQVEL